MDKMFDFLTDLVIKLGTPVSEILVEKNAICRSMRWQLLAGKRLLHYPPKPCAWLKPQGGRLQCAAFDHSLAYFHPKASAGWIVILFQPLPIRMLAIPPHFSALDPA